MKMKKRDCKIYKPLASHMANTYKIVGCRIYENMKNIRLAVWNRLPGSSLDDIGALPLRRNWNRGRLAHLQVSGLGIVFRWASVINCHSLSQYKPRTGVKQ